MDNFLYYGEVVEVILSDNDPEYQNYIKCRLIDRNSYITARSISKQFKYIPVSGEIVLLLYAPAPYYSANEKQYEYYYLFSINLHENINHNALFNATTTYKSSLTEGSSNEKFGSDFKEVQVNDLQPYEGDSLIQGRFGNAIRLSKTNIKNNLNHPSTWVKASDDYNPIILISNNIEKKDLSKNKFTTEDINKDGSSIYVTYKQKVNLELSSPLFDSFETKPIQPNDFTDNQILLNSDRVLINAKKDIVFLNAKKAVSLSSDKSVNIDSKENTIISSAKTFVGNKNATEPLLFGEKTDAWLNELLGILTDLLTALAAHNHGTGVGPSTVPIISLPDFQGTLPGKIEQIKAKIEQLKSKKNFVD